MASKGYILVEGHGEVEATHNLVTRLGNELGFYLPWAHPRRWKNLHRWTGRRGGIEAGAEFIRTKTDAGALLILRDEDDGCPKDLAPGIANRLASLGLPFPVAYVLLHPEYEVLFLPCLSLMKGAGFAEDLRWDADSWEARRGIKEWLSSKLPRGISYKPTVDQLPMTRAIDFALLRAAEVPCFGSLERGLGFLASHMARPGMVYPDPGPAPG